ncbi:unnamed protein product [Diamesa tonsa]
MDIIYCMGDSNFFRSPLQTRDYEKFPLEDNNKKKPQQQHYSQKAKGSTKKSPSDIKKSCEFCKEQKKRPLNQYIKKEKCRSESICEEEPETP